MREYRREEQQGMRSGKDMTQPGREGRKRRVERRVCFFSVPGRTFGKRRGREREKLSDLLCLYLLPWRIGTR